MDLHGQTIDQLNATLEERINQLRAETEVSRCREMADELNDFLYSLIHSHAPEVNAMQISVRARLGDERKDLPDFGYRAWLTRYLQKALPRKTKGTVAYTFSVHLPFAFTTGTHGSGERAARSASWENMAFHSYYYRNQQKVRWYLSLNLNGGSWLSKREVYFAPTEIRKIVVAQVNDTDYSPFFDPRGESLISGRLALDHYIHFRNFSCYSVEPDKVPAHPWKEEILAVAKNVAVPQFKSPLLKKKWNEPYLDGFAVFFPDDKVAELYQFKKVHLPKGFSNDYGENAVSAAYAIVAHRKTPQPNIRIYKSMEAIARLHQIKEERRF